MPLNIVRNDITKMSVDAIVNAANPNLQGGGGVDGAIHQAAGPELLAQCRTLPQCPPGEVRVTRGYRLSCKYILHTVGPIWQGGKRGEAEILARCYRACLQTARELECETVAFPLISAGAYGYPREQALEVATRTIRQFLEQWEMEVSLVIFDRETASTLQQRYADLRRRVRDLNVERGMFSRNARIREPEAMPMMDAAAPELDAAVRQLDESFSEMLLRKIDEKGLTDAQCYKKANNSRKLFSKFRCDRQYRPSKTTVLAFAVALELPLAETREMLMKAGFALSRSCKFDVIVEYFLSRGVYDIYEINEALFAFDQSLLGS